MEKRSEAWFRHVRIANRSSLWLVASAEFDHDCQRESTAVAPAAGDDLCIRYQSESGRFGGPFRKEEAEGCCGKLQVHFLGDGIPQDWEGMPNADPSKDLLARLCDRKPDYQFRFDVNCFEGTSEVRII
jgi:hypothetical protein